MPFNISEVHVQGGNDAKEWPYKFCASHGLDGSLFTEFTIRDSSCLVTITAYFYLYSFAICFSFGWFACLFVCLFYVIRCTSTLIETLQYNKSTKTNIKNKNNTLNRKTYKSKDINERRHLSTNTTRTNTMAWFLLT